jgi:hypothetical protein
VTIDSRREIRHGHGAEAVLQLYSRSEEFAASRTFCQMSEGIGGVALRGIPIEKGTQRLLM